MCMHHIFSYVPPTEKCIKPTIISAVIEASQYMFCTSTLWGQVKILLVFLFGQCYLLFVKLNERNHNFRLDRYKKSTLNKWHSLFTVFSVQWPIRSSTTILFILPKGQRQYTHALPEQTDGQPDWTPQQNSSLERRHGFLCPQLLWTGHTGLCQELPNRPHQRQWVRLLILPFLPMCFTSTTGLTQMLQLFNRTKCHKLNIFIICCVDNSILCWNCNDEWQ